jgi:hypothetical protein
MALLDKLQNQESTLSGLNGATPSIPVFKESTLHKEYSINGEPEMVNKPTPSNLDLNGATPSKYMDNLPS